MNRIVIALLFISSTLMFREPNLAFGEGTTPLNARLLSDFTNDNGSKPDGKDNENDDTSAFRKSLAVGPGKVYVGPGYYRCSEVTIPAHVSIIGAGNATVIRPLGTKSVFVQDNVTDWSIRDLKIDGQAKGPWKNRKDEGQSGILIQRCSGFTLSGINVTNFSGAGVQISHTLGSIDGWASRANMDTITATGNYVGVRFDKRAEYINATKFSCQNNVVGCVIHAGNVKLTASNLTSNRDGLHIEDKENGSHGAISNCLFNHNDRNALCARNVANGMAITNSCFFYGRILIENSVGVNIDSGQISCSVSVSGKGVNRIAGNYVIPENWEFTFTPTTIVKDNFTAEGPWRQNQRSQ